MRNMTEVKTTTKTSQSKKLKELSVFFPCYNEEENLDALMTQVLDVIPRYAEKYEIILINDGSKDRTSEIAHSYAAKNPNVKVIDQENKGYGGALKVGLKACKYEWIFFSDSDLQFDLQDLEKFVQKALTDKYDLVIGYRMNRAEGFKRWALAKSLKVWGKVFLGFPLSIIDIDCAFKLFRKTVVDRMGGLASNGNLISTEFLLKAYRNNFRFYQIGVKHYLRKAGESTCGDMGDVVQAIKETFLLRRLMDSSRPVTKPAKISRFALISK